MTVVKLLSWNATAKEIKFQSGSQVQLLSATYSLFFRILVIKRGHWPGIYDWHARVSIHQPRGVYPHPKTLQQDPRRWPYPSPTFPVSLAHLLFFFPLLLEVGTLKCLSLHFFSLQEVSGVSPRGKCFKSRWLRLKFVHFWAMYDHSSDALFWVQRVWK